VNDINVHWSVLHYTDRPVMTPDVLEQLHRHQVAVNTLKGPALQIIRSENPSVFSLGGDLALFVELIESRSRQRLHQYARQCIALINFGVNHPKPDLLSVSMIEGDTYGGGLEMALATDYLIAEEQARFGFPEALFGLFPGMGAYHLLCRRVSPGLARKMITTAQTYSAREMLALGLVDEVVAEGAAESSMKRFIKRFGRTRNAFLATSRLGSDYHAITLQNLEQTIAIWVDCALELSDSNRRLMKKLRDAQLQRWCAEENTASQKVRVS